MDIQKDIFLKYMAKAAVEQIALEYTKKGYEVNPAEAAELGADLVVKKGKEVILFEIKMGEWDAGKRKAIKEIRNRAVRELGARFKLVFVNLPEEPKIEIEDLERMFFELLPEHFINEFNRLATHFWMEEVSDIDITELSIRKEEIEVSGCATVTLGLQYGSDSDFERGDGLRTQESFPFKFHILLDRELGLREVFSLTLDMPEHEE